MAPRESHEDEDHTRDRYTVYWVAAAFAGIGVVGMIIVPAGKWIWITVIVLALLAIPQAFVSTRSPRRRRRY